MVARLHTRTRQRITAIQTFGSPLTRLRRKFPDIAWVDWTSMASKNKAFHTATDCPHQYREDRAFVCPVSIYGGFSSCWICRGAWECPDNLVGSYPLRVGLWLEAPREGCFGSLCSFVDSKNLSWDLQEMKWLERCLEQYSEKAKLDVTKAGNSSMVIGVAKCQFLADSCPMARFRIAQKAF